MSSALDNHEAVVTWAFFIFMKHYTIKTTNTQVSLNVNQKQRKFSTSISQCCAAWRDTVALLSLIDRDFKVLHFTAANTRVLL